MSCTAMTFSMVACGGASTDTTTPADTSADTETEAPAEEAEAPAEEEAEAPAEDGTLTYSSITLGEDYTDLTATIKWLHHKTDRAEDGTIDKMIAEFNKDYPNITVEAEAVTDYAEDALLRLSTGDWGDIMFIPAVDKRAGSEWFWEVDPEGKPYEGRPIVEPWKCPYHNGRMCFEVIKRSRKEGGKF